MTRIFLRKSDFVARCGGDELAVVLRETSLKESLALGERLLRAVRALPMDREGVRFQLTLSIGAAALKPGEEPQSWIERTDRALVPFEARRPRPDHRGRVARVGLRVGVGGSPGSPEVWNPLRVPRL